MSKNLGHQELVWVVPCVGDIDYPKDRRAKPMTVTIFGTPYIIQVQYHQLENITYVLLDAPVFRARRRSEPYPCRMDDIGRAIYYSAWYVLSIYHISLSVSSANTLVIPWPTHSTIFIIIPSSLTDTFSAPYISFLHALFSLFFPLLFSRALLQF